jgi:hypothetical protein
VIAESHPVSLAADTPPMEGNVRAGKDFDNFVYFLGKFVYIIDAADDIGEDLKKGKYNPLIQAFGIDEVSCAEFYKRTNEDRDFLTYSRANEIRAGFFERNKEELDFLVFSCINKMRGHFAAMKLTEAADLLSNVINLGFERKYKQVLASTRKLRQERI